MRLVGVSEPGCPAIPVQVVASTPIDTQQCVALRQQFQGLLADLKPKALILTQHDGYLGAIMSKNGTVPAREIQIEEWRQAYASFLKSLRGANIVQQSFLTTLRFQKSHRRALHRGGRSARANPVRQTPWRSVVRFRQPNSKYSANCRCLSLPPTRCSAITRGAHSN